MNVFDREILLWLNQFARTSRALDLGVAWIATSNAVKGGILTVVLLWFWFSESPERARRRAVILATGFAAGVSIAVGRLLATTLPFRMRPVHDAALGFVAPYGYPEGLLRTWSAFPSDHAMLFGAMATGLLLVSRRAGILAAVWVTVVVLLPRVYLGMHHPTDVLFGAALGVALALAANAPRVRERITRAPLRWAEAHPPSFYAAGFVAAMQLATMFEGPRETVRELAALLRSDVPPAEAASGPPGTTVLPVPAAAPGSAEPLEAVAR